MRTTVEFVPRSVIRLVGRVAVGKLAGLWVVWRCWQPSNLRDHLWAAFATIVVMGVIAAVLPAAGRRLPWPGSVPVLIGVMQFAVYCCVPETDQIPRVALLVGVLFSVEFVFRRVMPWWVQGVVVTMVMWSGIFGATGRDSALVGALFAAWPIVLVAVVPRVPALQLPVPRVPVRLASVLSAGLGSVAAVAVARTGALQSTIGPALVAVAIAAPVSVVLAALGGRLLGDDGAHPLDGGE
jgi:hypothetical protein